MFPTVDRVPEGVRMIDQRVLPAREEYVVARSAEEAARAIREMVVRGAPAIGVTAAYGAAVEATRLVGLEPRAFDDAMERALETLATSRPTAVNLFWAVGAVRDELARCRAGGVPPAERVRRLEALARKIDEDDVASCRAIGRYGAALLPDRATVLTHCNAGGLATAGYGTALGVVRGAIEAGKRVRVFADETRPFLQGARLTAWELMRDGIETVLIADNMAGSVLRRGEVDAVVVGADRVARNGDFANKIGTYPLAVLAREHGVPFYVAAPLSTIDLECPSGESIPIEERDPREVTELFGTRIAPEGVGVINPAFDVTPARLVAALITEAGIVRAPYETSIPALFERATPP